MYPNVNKIVSRFYGYAYLTLCVIDKKSLLTGLTPVRSSGPTGQAGYSGFIIFAFPEERQKILSLFEGVASL